MTPELGRSAPIFPGVVVSITVPVPLASCLLFGTVLVSSITVTGVDAVDPLHWALDPEGAEYKSAIAASADRQTILPREGALFRTMFSLYTEWNRRPNTKKLLEHNSNPSSRPMFEMLVLTSLDRRTKAKPFD